MDVTLFNSLSVSQLRVEPRTDRSTTAYCHVTLIEPLARNRHPQKPNHQSCKIYGTTALRQLLSSLFLFHRSGFKFSPGPPILNALDMGRQPKYSNGMEQMKIRAMKK